MSEEEIGDILHKHRREIDRLKKRVGVSLRSTGEPRSPTPAAGTRTHSHTATLGDGGVLGVRYTDAGIAIPFDGGGSPLDDTFFVDVPIPIDCTYEGWTLVAKEAGDLIVDLWLSTFAGFPPDVGDTITAGGIPTLSAEDHAAQDVAPVQIIAGDILRVAIQSGSVVDITRATLGIILNRTIVVP